MSHRYPSGPSAEYLEERVHSGDIEERQKGTNWIEKTVEL